MSKTTAAIFFVVALSMLNTICIAQEAAAGSAPEMADGLRASGKIYVVVAVLVTILLGIVLYLVKLERKITKLEKHK